MKLKHIDLMAGSVYQDARDVKTKFSKTFSTFFFPVGDDIQQIVTNWVGYLRQDKLWGNEDPLFPAPWLLWAKIENLGWRASTAITGATQRQSGKYSEMHLQLLACRISIHIVCAKLWSSLAKHVAAHRRSSRHGVRILIMRKF
jgi:hypothetical protein